MRNELQTYPPSHDNDADHDPEEVFVENPTFVELPPDDDDWVSKARVSLGLGPPSEGVRPYIERYRTRDGNLIHVVVTVDEMGEETMPIFLEGGISESTGHLVPDTKFFYKLSTNRLAHTGPTESQDERRFVNDLMIPETVEQTRPALPDYTKFEMCEKMIKQSKQWRNWIFRQEWLRSTAPTFDSTGVHGHDSGRAPPPTSSGRSHTRHKKGSGSSRCHPSTHTQPPSYGPVPFPDQWANQ